jgi:hypothetical protein
MRLRNSCDSLGKLLIKSHLVLPSGLQTIGYYPTLFYFISLSIC